MIITASLLSSCSHPAVDMARKICKDAGGEIPANADAIVEDKDGTYIVTFPRHHPPGTVGGDFIARVVIDKATGKRIGGIEISR